VQAFSRRTKPINCLFAAHFRNNGANFRGLKQGLKWPGRTRPALDVARGLFPMRFPISL
jgi:hypothetical protein